MRAVELVTELLSPSEDESGPGSYSTETEDQRPVSGTFGAVADPCAIAAMP